MKTPGGPGDVTTTIPVLLGQPTPPKPSEQLIPQPPETTNPSVSWASAASSLSTGTTNFFRMTSPVGGPTPRCRPNATPARVLGRFT